MQEQQEKCERGIENTLPTIYFFFPKIATFTSVY